MEVFQDSLVCSVRIPGGILAKIDEHIKHGCAINRADFIRRAIYSELRKEEFC